jgi:hypothetical protein
MSAVCVAYQSSHTLRTEELYNKRAPVDILLNPLQK